MSEIEPLDLSFHELPDKTNGDKKNKKSSSVKSGTTYNCADCERTYLSKDALARHVKMHNSAFKCKTCTTVFDSEESLNNHKRDKHQPIHLCAVCGKSFWRRSVLSTHAALHTEEGKPHICPYKTCKRRFSRKDLLGDHINSHTGNKPYKCVTCKRPYSSRSSYSHHVKCCSKSPSCPSCDKKFTTDSALADHIKSEHETSWFVCTCGKRYRWRTNLARHRRSCSSIEGANLDSESRP